jgi:RNA-binding protein 26
MECPYEHSPDSIYAPSQPSSSNGQFQIPAFPPFHMMNGFPMGMPMGMMPGMGGSPPGPGFGASPFAGRIGASPPVAAGVIPLDKGKAPAKDGDVEMLDTVRTNGADTGDATNGADDNSYSPNQPGQAAVQSPTVHPMSPGGMPVPGMEFGMGMMGYPPMMGMPQNMMMGMSGPSGFGGRGRGGRGGFRGGQRGAMNGMSFGGQTSNRPPKEGTNNTLVITEIPLASMSLEAVNNHFKQFGTVTNVALEAREKKALVAFSSAHEAHAAWKSDQPVFNSRHVKVLWHRPMEGHGSKGQEALEASAPLLQNMRKIEAEGAQAIQGSVVTSHEKQAQAKARVEEIQAQQRVMEKHIAEQRVLFARLEGKPADPVEKRSIKTRLKEVSKELESLQPIDIAELQSLMAIIKPKKPLPQKRMASNPAEGVHSVKELLDQDMEGEVDADTLALREKVKQLRAEVRRCVDCKF